MQFSQILKCLREEKYVTQKEVANACGVTPTCICQLENGSRSPTGTTLKALSEYFNVSIDYLVGKNDDFKLGIIPGDTFTSEERELIELYRSLSPLLKNTTLETLRTWAGKKPPQNYLHKKA